MKHIAIIFLLLLFGSPTIYSTTQELSDEKSLNDDGGFIRLKRNSRAGRSLNEIMSLKETVQHAISVLVTRQNEALQNLEAKVAILPTKLEALQTKLSAIEAQIGRVEDALDTKMSSLNSTIMRKMESLKTELKASVINNGDSITIISREQKKLQLQTVQVEERLESMNFSLLYQVEKTNAASNLQLMSINSSLHFKLDEFKTDMHCAAMNATLLNTQILNSIEKSNNISLVLHQIPHTNEWVVIQRRGIPLKHGRIREEFKDRNWGDYARGFGEIDADYWIGLEAIHLLNSAGFNQLRVDLEDWEGNKAYAEYDAFALSAASDKYRLSISGYRGNAGDSFAFVNGSQFSTKDNDNDAHSSFNYAAERGPWWFGNGGNCWLNSRYQNGSDVGTNYNRIVWYRWKELNSLKKTEMKLRRRQL